MTKPKIKLPFGKDGQLTPETLRAAGLTAEEHERAEEMLEVQQAFLDILDHLSYPVDPDGHIHDLNHMQPTKIAIAWTLALSGMRKTGTPRIKKRKFAGGSVYGDAHTWIDVRKPNTAAEELQPEHNSKMPHLPPDTRRLAALRDGEEPHIPDQTWKTTAKVERVYEKRSEE